MSELLKHLQQDIHEWSDKTFGTDPERIIGMCSHLKEESEELYKAVWIYRKFLASKESEESINSVKESAVEEIADCMMLLLDIASHLPISFDELEKAVFNKLRVNYKREWDIPAKDGKVNHVRKEETHA